MGRRSGNQQHFQAPVGPEKDTQQSKHSKSIGLSTRFKDHQHTSHKPAGISRAQLAREKAHSQYPYGRGVYWFSIIAFVSFVLASLYWITYFATSA